MPVSGILRVKAHSLFLPPLCSLCEIKTTLCKAFIAAGVKTGQGTRDEGDQSIRPHNGPEVVSKKLKLGTRGITFHGIGTPGNNPNVSTDVTCTNK